MVGHGALQAVDISVHKLCMARGKPSVQESIPEEGSAQLSTNNQILEMILRMGLGAAGNGGRAGLFPFFHAVPLAVCRGGALHVSLPGASCNESGSELYGARH